MILVFLEQQTRSSGGSSGYAAQFNARASQALVTDPAGTTYLLGNEVYPTTRSALSAFGFDADASAGARDRDSANDPRLAGIILVSNSAAQRTFRIDGLSAGSVDIRLALGDSGDVSGEQYAYVYDSDGTTLLFAIEDNATFPLTNQFLNANGVLRTGGTAGTWVANYTADKRSVTITGSTLYVKLGRAASDRSDVTKLAHLSVVGASAGGTAYSDTLTPSAGASDSTSVQGALSVALSDGTGASDASTGTQASTDAYGGPAGAAESVAALVSVSVALSDSAGATEEVALQASTTDTLSDSAGAADAAASAQGYSDSLIVPAGAADDADAIANAYASLSDASGASEAILPLASLTNDVVEAAAAAGDAQALALVSDNADSVAGASETLSVETAFSALAAGDTGAADAWIDELSSAGSGEFTGAGQVADALDAVGSAADVALDSASVSDGWADLWGASEVLVSFSGAVDLSEAVAAASPSFTEALGASDSVEAEYRPAFTGPFRLTLATSERTARLGATERLVALSAAERSVRFNVPRETLPVLSLSETLPILLLTED